MANPSLSEYLAQSQRGLYQSVFGPEMGMRKAFSGTFTVDTATGIFDATYGRKVWQALNNQTRFFNAIPRTVWGNTAGWRVRTDRGSGRSQPVSEAGDLPTVDISNIETVSSLPRIVSTTFGASVKSIFTAQLEGGIGDVLALENENAQLDHVKEINEELLAGSAYIISGGGADSFTVPASIGKHFKIGDAVSTNDDGVHGRATGSVVSAVSGGTVTVATGTAFVNGDAVAIYSRAGFTSIDDIVAEDGALVGGVTNGVRVRAYNLTQGGRTAGGWNAGASVSYGGGTARALSLTLIDTAIQKIRENGGEPKLILLGHDQYFNLERLLNSNQRYMGQEEYQVGVGSERTFPGTRTGLVLATYQGIPILPDADVPKSVSSSSDAVLGTNVYVLDTDYLEIAVAQPTQYVENRDYFAANALVVRGLLYTMGEMRCKNIFVQAKIADLSA
jgi:hypothetical protein